MHENLTIELREFMATDCSVVFLVFLPFVSPCSTKYCEMLSSGRNGINPEHLSVCCHEALLTIKWMPRISFLPQSSRSVIDEKVQSRKFTRKSFSNCLRLKSDGKKRTKMSTHTIRLRQRWEKNLPDETYRSVCLSHIYISGFMSVYSIFISISRHGEKTQRQSKCSVGCLIYLNIEPRKIFM